MLLIKDKYEILIMLGTRCGAVDCGLWTEDCGAASTLNMMGAIALANSCDTEKCKFHRANGTDLDSYHFNAFHFDSQAGKMQHVRYKSTQLEERQQGQRQRQRQSQGRSSCTACLAGSM